MVDKHSDVRKHEAEAGREFAGHLLLERRGKSNKEGELSRATEWALREKALIGGYRGGGQHPSTLQKNQTSPQGNEKKALQPAL